MKYWILLLAVAGMSYAVYSQNHHPPPPNATESQGNGRGLCGKFDGTRPGRGPGIPPPVGLCLPINDYLLPLLLSGIALGSFMVWRLEKPVKASQL